MSKTLTGLIISIVTLFASAGQAQVDAPGSVEALRVKTIQKARELILPQLRQYCGESCELLKIDVEIREEITDTTEIGFEAVANQAAQPLLYVNQIEAEIQVDERVTKNNRERLEAILINHLKGAALSSKITWVPIQLPNIGTMTGTASFLKRKLEKRLDSVIRNTLQTYCPNTCLLAYIGIEGELISLDQSAAVPSTELIRDETGRSVLRVEQINVDITMDETLSEEERLRIADVLRAKTKFASPINYNISVTKFPETYADKLKKEKQDDPYGLEKLRQMLIMFRDLAGTKEIITTKTSQTNKTEESQLTSSEIEKSKAATIDSSLETSDSGTSDWVLWGSIALAALFVIILAARYLSANKDAKMMIEGSGLGGSDDVTHEHKNEDPSVINTGTSAEAVTPEQLALKLKIENLRSELMDRFMKLPKVAKETFSRMLKEEGVEETSKYLQIFGHMIILELIDDTNLSRELYALSEFFHKSKFTFSLEEEHELLRSLKTRVTAAEIRVLSTHHSDRFDFLDKLDPAQVYTLIAEEKPQVQSIVLTQLDKKRRMAVFDMYQGDAKLHLMTELSRADAIPKEFMHNVAKALSKKVRSRPEFDTENIRSSEIIIDLMERSDLAEQRQIMARLRESNPDTARGILMRLVTIEILPYLKDGHLLEMILGTEREDLLMFLSGTKPEIRDLLLNKAPYELAESWMEDLETMGSVEDKNYRLVELKIFNKIRSLANSGSISILDINEMIFAPENDPGTQEQLGQFSENSAVA